MSRRRAPASVLVSRGHRRRPDPAHDGLRIAHLSDIHAGNPTPAEHVRAAVELANAAADVIA
jgi:predicted MPP superfamily phosphohydrolase